MHPINLIAGILLILLAIVLVIQIVDYFVTEVFVREPKGIVRRFTEPIPSPQGRANPAPDSAEGASSKEFFNKGSDENSSEIKVTEPTKPEPVTYTNRVVRKGLVPINWSGIELEPYELTFKESSRGDKHFNFIACHYRSHTSIEGIDGNYIKADRVTFTKEGQGNDKWSVTYTAGTHDYSTASGSLYHAPVSLKAAFTELIEANGFKGLN